MIDLDAGPPAPRAVTAGGDLLLAQGPDCGARQVTSLTSAGPADGRPRWTVRFPSGRPVIVGPDWFAAIDGAGTLDTYTLGGGERLDGGTGSTGLRLVCVDAGGRARLWRQAR